MDKKTLIKKCSSLGITGISSKPKHEIIKIIEDQAKLYEILDFEIEDFEDNNDNDTEQHGIVHNTPKKYIKSTENPDEINYHNDLQELLTLNTIHTDNNVKQKFNIQSYLDDINLNATYCNECNNKLYNIQTNTNRIWQHKHICDSCWHNHSQQREHTWTLIKLYKPIICNLCNHTQINNSQRFHYDHLNMFQKTHTIYKMVNEGYNIQDIYNEIDKCQILCIRCHHIITHIERKHGFIYQKIILNKKLRYNIITLQQHQQIYTQLQNKYHDTMQNIYKELQTYFTNKNT